MSLSPGKLSMLCLVKFFSLFVVVQLLSHVQLFATPWTAACQASLSITISQSLLKLTFIELVMPSNHLIFCHPLLLLPSILVDSKLINNQEAPHPTSLSDCPSHLTLSAPTTNQPYSCEYSKILPHSHAFVLSLVCEALCR